jgi:hypothetical protein
MRHLKELTLSAIIMAACILYGCASVPIASPEYERMAKSFPPPPGMASVYIYRPYNFMGSAITLKITIDDKTSGSVTPGTYLFGNVVPGRHIIGIIDPRSYAKHSQVAQSEIAQLDAEPGKLYFFNVVPDYLTHFEIKRVTDEDARNEISRCSLSGDSIFDPYAIAESSYSFSKLPFDQRDLIEALPLQKYDGHHNLFPMGILKTAAVKLKLGSPDWKKRAVGRTTGIGDWMDKDTFRELGGGYPPGYAAAAYIVFYLPSAAAGGYVWGQMSENKWSPCIERLSRNIYDLNPSAGLQTALRNSLSEGGVVDAVELETETNRPAKTSTMEIKSIIEAEVIRVRLQECSKHGTFGVEIGARIRLKEIRTNQYLYDSIIVVNQSEVVAGPPSPKGDVSNLFYCSGISNYCDENGPDLLCMAIRKGVQQISDRVFYDLGLTIR